MRKVPAVLVWFLASAALAFAQNANVLQGKVIAPGGTQPTSPVRVRLTFNGRAINETFTDLSGHFSFPGLNRGTYQLTAEGDGLTFETTSIYAEISAFGSAPQSFTQDIQLRPMIHRPAAQAGVVNAFSQVVPKAAQQQLERGLRLAKEGQTEEAIAKMHEAIQLFSSYFDAHLQLGNTFLATGRLSEAIAELDLAREINPDDERSYQSFGLVLMKQKNYAVAAAVFAEAARLNPGNPTNLLMRGTALIHQASTLNDANPSRLAEDQSPLLSQAEVALSQASNLSGNKLKADNITLALLYEMRGEPDRAADELESLLRKASHAKNAPALQAEIRRLREKGRAGGTKP
jgi:tetratricopeptide (TPR) repeat protein